MKKYYAEPLTAARNNGSDQEEYDILYLSIYSVSLYIVFLCRSFGIVNFIGKQGSLTVSEDCLSTINLTVQETIDEGKELTMKAISNIEKAFSAAD